MLIFFNAAIYKSKPLIFLTSELIAKY